MCTDRREGRWLVDIQVNTMRKILTVNMMLWATALLAACGGGGSDAAFQPGNTATTPPAVASVTVTSSRATILSDGTQTATVVAFVRDPNNALLASVPVTFSASSGGITPASATTGTEGTATGTVVTAGDTTLRTITITARAGNFTGTTTIQVISAQPPVTVGSLTLTTSTPTLPSDGSLTATITAITRDASNNFVSGIPVLFSTNSGGLQSPSPNTTNASGSVAATLTTANDPRNRTITVTATAGGLTQTVSLAVSGSKLTIQGPTGLVLGATASYTVTLANSSDQGIANQSLAITSLRGNTLTPASITTDATGRGTFTLNITQPGNETLTAAGFGLTATQAVSINSDSFVFSAPAANTEIPLATAQPLTIRWLSANTPVVGQVISFTTTRGLLSSATATTDANGDATVTVSSSSAGGAVVTATAGGASAQQPIEFIALNASSIDVQSNVFSVAPNEQATLTAVVRDAAGNLVKNKVVTFTLQDVTGGTLSLASGTTNSLGRAQTVYTASSSTSARDGVVITSSVAGSGGITVTDTVALTVASKVVFISLGTGNTLEEPNVSQYKIQFTIQLTDANGNGVPNVDVATSALTLRFLKGTRRFANGSWSNYNSPVYTCTDEDTLVPATARNGQLDVGEDFNNNGRLDVGNVALASPATARTNAQGVATVDILYPQDVAYWLEIEIEARAAVQGTEFRRTSAFLVPGLAADFNNEQVGPPGPRSPFGTNPCNVNQ
jgi:hypothetical protein